MSFLSRCSLRALRPSALRPVAPAVAALGLLALVPPAAAQGFDASVLKIEVNQAIQTGTTALAAGRATFVRAAVRVVNPPSNPVPVDGLLRVYVGGVEVAGSPYFSDNGPFPAKPGVDFTSEDGTLNFVFLPPQASNVVLAVEVNPAGPSFVPEAVTSNNVTLTAPLSFGFQRAPDLAYSPIDYRPSGGPTPNLPDPELIEPGMGNNFVLGIYPTPDWRYHRTDAPSKLWTSSLASSGSSLLTSLQADKALMSPEPDFLYAWVPGGLSYNGQAIIGGDVSMGNTEPIRFQRTLAHELAHNFGLQHNTLTTGLVGLDIEEHLHLTQGLGLVKGASLKDIMYAGLLTHEAWVASPSYNHFFTHPVFDPQGPQAADAGGSARLLVTGLWNTATGALETDHVLRLPPGKLTSPAAAPDLIVRAFAGGALLAELPIAAANSTDACSGCGDADSAIAGSPVAAFSALLPVPVASIVDRVTVEQAGPRSAAALELRASAAAPRVAFTQPAGGALPGGPMTVTWSASDADGDELLFYLRYSPDGGRFVPLASGLTATSHDVDFAQLPALVDGAGFLELLASDGLNTSVVRSEPLASPEAATGTPGSAPWVHVVTPDDGLSILRGATLVLHASGWDLEDHALPDEGLAWSSSLDGPLGLGRLLSVSGLSAGTHVITLTGLDSDSQQATDTTTITVMDRGLPAVGVTCQADLGFGGPGASQLSLCGGDLASGSTATLSLVGAPASSAALMLGGFVNAPTPFKGGLLVPVPADILTPFVTDAGGSIELSVDGGAGPLTLYLQFVVADASQPAGLGLSNALQVELLP